MLLVELCIWKMQGLFIEPHLLSLHCDLLIFSYLDFSYFRNNFKSLSDHVYKQMIAWLPLNLNTTTTATNNNTTMEKKNVCKWHLTLTASNSTLLVGSAEKHFETTCYISIHRLMLRMHCKHFSLPHSHSQLRITPTCMFLHRENM